MHFDTPKNINYAAQVIRVPVTVALPGLDNLVGVPVLGCQALTQKDGVAAGDLKVAFTAETQLSEQYASTNNLHRDATLNADGETGYLEKNRRIKAIRLRGNASNALLMPLSSLAWTGVDVTRLSEGDMFDTLNGHEICRKYEVPVKCPSRAQTKIAKAFRRVDKKLFPEHLETDAYWRSRHMLDGKREVVITQKLHGTSWRGGRVPVLRKKGWLERLMNRFFSTPDYEYDVIFGSRKVIKDPANDRHQHYYDSDIWTAYGKTVADLIPEGYLVYGELIGFTPDGAELQKNYTYNLAQNDAELYVYRVAHINQQGRISDLSWDGVKAFCRERDMKWVPELVRSSVDGIDVFLDSFLDERLADHGGWNEAPLVVSHHLTVDEGVCLRQEGQVPVILKAKSPVFLEHESKLLDRGEVDMESAA